MPIDYLLNAFATLFVTIDPLGLAPIFAAVTVGLTPSARRRTAIRSVIIAALVLLAFAFFGEGLLGTLGITLGAFRIAGGLMLLWIGFEMVFEKRTVRKQQTADNAAADPVDHDLAAFPLAVPLMAGPGSITAVILLAGEARNGEWWLQAMLAGTVMTILLICLFIFLLAGMIEKVLGTTGRIIMSRLLGVLLAALAVQFIVDGVRELLVA
ncbi:MAG: MarC family protein [Rhizobiales bacterium]|nr:MarC family protein [Hyphomicrobiales bacterium]